jgi:hypothetical protein
LPGRSYLALLADAGFSGAKILEPTGFTTSKYTAAHLIAARR